MLVKNYMSTALVVVKPNASVIKAQILLKEHDISHLPVMEEEKLLGIISDRDIKKLLIPSETLLVKNIMTRNPVTVPWDYTIGETAEILLKHNISAVPVVDPQGRVVGIITKGDLFRVLVPLTGVGEKGIQLALVLADRRGAIQEITDLIRENGGRMMSVLTSYDDAPKGALKLYLRMYGIDRKNLKTLKEKIMEKAFLLYLVDHRENIREIFADNGSIASEQIVHLRQSSPLKTA
jgi:acetoin utilization protein AcuB